MSTTLERELRRSRVNGRSSKKKSTVHDIQAQRTTKKMITTAVTMTAKAIIGW